MARERTRLIRSLFLPAAERFRDLHWQPAVDVYQTRTGWLIKVELAGVRPEDIHLSVAGRQLTIRGRRRDWFSEATACCYRLEITYSDFERTLELPRTLERARIATDYQYGLLLVQIQTEDVP
jgi:HSP20 family protein